MKLENKDSVALRNVTHPNMEQKKYYSALKFKHTNLKMRKKWVKNKQCSNAWRTVLK